MSYEGLTAAEDYDIRMLLLALDPDLMKNFREPCLMSAPITFYFLRVQYMFQIPAEA